MRAFIIRRLLIALPVTLLITLIALDVGTSWIDDLYRDDFD